MTTKLRPTFAICIAAGLAAGIALARPPQESQAAPVDVAVPQDKLPQDKIPQDEDPQYRDGTAGVDAQV